MDCQISVGLMLFFLQWTLCIRELRATSWNYFEILHIISLEKYNQLFHLRQIGPLSYKCILIICLISSQMEQEKTGVVLSQ